MAPIPKVYLPEEIAEFLRLSPGVVIRAIESGEIPALRVGGEWRVTETALLRFLGDNVDRDAGHSGASEAPVVVDDRRALRDGQMFERVPARAATTATRFHPGSPAGSVSARIATGLGASAKGQRDTDPSAVRWAQEWVWKRLRAVASDLRPYAPSKEFTANAKQGVLSIATKEERPEWYFFGFPQDLLKTGWPTFLVAVIALRDRSEPRAFVIPCDTYRSDIEQWSVDKGGQKKYHINAKATGSYYLSMIGKQAVAIGQYLNAFHLLR